MCLMSYRLNSNINASYGRKSNQYKDRVVYNKHQMSQIININVGKAGVRIGQKFIQKIANQHFADSNQVRGRPQVFFNQTQKGHYQTRAVFIDIDPRSIDKINLKTQPYRIPEQNIFKGSGLFSDLFSQGKYHEGAQIAYQAFNSIQREVEKCDKLSGFLLCNSIAGGTGSGTTAQIISNLRQFYCDKIVQQHFLLPQTDNPTSPLHIYNSVLAFNYSVEEVDFCVMAENKAVGRSLMADQNFRPTLNHINNIHAEHICQVTAPYRFSGSVNTNQRKTCTNLILFPRLKFMISSISTKRQRTGYLEDMLDPLNYSKTQFFFKKTNYYDIYTMQVNCRDNWAYESEIDCKVRLWLNEAKLTLTEWIPNNIHSSIIESVGSRGSGSMLINSRHVVTIFEKWAQIFTAQFRRKAFIHSYTSGGMDEMEFTQAQSNLNDLISEHIPCYGFEEQQLEDYPEEDNA